MFSISKIRQKIIQWSATARGALWAYPDTFFFSRSAYAAKVARVYEGTRPFSHFVSTSILVLVLVVVAFSPNTVPLFAIQTDSFIEGVVTGVDQNGNLQTLSKVSPLLPTAIQLEKDISELIYEPLIRYEQNASISLILAESIVRIQEGAEYEFVLRPDVYWHDGMLFGVDDVIRSLEIVSQLDDNNANSYVQAVKQMAWEKTGERSLLICTVRDRAEIAALENKCTGVSGEKPILANFLELISIKIIPAHLAGDINARTIDKPEPLLNRFPIGTGKYKFAGAEGNTITLVANDKYHGGKPNLKNVQFRLYRNETEAVSALKNGEVHGYATSSTENLIDVKRYPQLVAQTSPVLVNQYWALYFNLRKTPDGTPIGPAFLQDVNVRRAISAAVNRDEILEVLSQIGKEAKGPIPDTSEFYAQTAGWYTYDQQRAIQLLEQAGWVAKGRDGIRLKDGARLSFKLSYVDNLDRNRVVEVIKQDLSRVGIELVPEPRTLADLTTQVVTPKQFDTLLYGMNTFIDPDRFELFHSQQALRLNLSSYVGSEETVKIEEGKKVNLPRVDRLLEQARSFDPLLAKDKRKEDYVKFQELLAADAPVVFLYHPQFIYMLNSRVKNMDLNLAAAIEQRFRSVASWAL